MNLKEIVENFVWRYLERSAIFCGIHYEEKRVAIHRKDGRPHEERLTVYEKYFRTLNSDEWVPLCQNHQRFVHWAMDDLGLKWDDLKKFKIKEHGAEGEI